MTAGRLEQPARPDGPTVTLGDSYEDLRDASRHRQLAVGERFAGFEVRGILGHGAMGVVYDAWDPAAERRVALKLLRSPSRRAAERVLRDARALARLGHPAVVRIWAADVHRGALYLAMELVEGKDLREWMQTPRPWGEVLPVLISAGQGLAAAHAAGVIHRDFKPENVLVGWDGQVRVLDFGLARISSAHADLLDAGAHAEPAEHDDQSEDSVGDAAGEAGCGAGPLSGSFAALPIDADERPAPDEAEALARVRYFAPEQHMHARADERSDQFAFCLTLFEAIHGQHPFQAQTAQQLAQRVREGEVTLPAKAPRWLNRVLLRGLSVAPDDRFATMEDLLDALERHPSRRRRHKRVAAIGAIAVTAVALGIMIPRAGAVDACANVERELDATLGPAARDQLAARFAQLDQPGAAAGERVVAELGAWAKQWVEARQAICQSRHSHHEPTALDLRRATCLSGQLAQVSALTTALTHAEDRALRNAARTLAALPEPHACTGDDPPDARAHAEAATPLVTELEQLRWLTLAGGDSQTRGRAEDLVAKLRALPARRASGSLLAESLISLAIAERDEDALVDAEAHLREAARVSERVGADRVRARAMVELGWTLGSGLNSGLNSGLGAGVGAGLGSGHESGSRATEAIAVLEHTEALLERIGDPTFERQRQRQALAKALLAAGQAARARELFEGLLAEMQERGFDEITRASVSLSLSRVAAFEGDLTLSLRHAQAALTSYERHGEHHSPLLAEALREVARAQTALGRHEAAGASLTRAVELRRQLLDSQPTAAAQRHLAELLIELATVHSKLGERGHAAQGYREALALIPEHDFSNRALILLELGADHQRAARWQQALANYQESLRLAERVHPMDSSQVVSARLGVGNALLNLERPAQAREPLQRSLADWPATMAGTAQAAQLRFDLAQTLAALDGWATPVETLAHDAHAIYMRLGLTERAAAVEAWRAMHRPPPMTP
ncbi:protein kinase domain-containing protein [Enhygromyxa salina]|uniref:protein kinase domain-containing protein n=1 Tax=Enhygromyxa salina TaxID=215803 RepID=UPI0011B286E9|nr:serine/threonine-protein kinase [Enhygromyxa salina]